jgi:type VI secretion system protein ImpH
MADTNGNPANPLIEELFKRPFAFDFFLAVRLIESLQPDRPRVGFSLSPAEDSVRFWQKPTLRFAPSAIDSVWRPHPDSVPRIAINFFGLFGPNAPMPPHITEYALERELHFKDTTLTAFFNIFHQRLTSMFYRAWASTQKAADLDRPADQRFATFIGSFFGVGMEALQDRDAVPDLAKLFFAGRLSAQTRNAEGLAAILREYFHIPAEVLPFAGRWLTLPDDSVCQLAASPESGTMGVNTILGSRFWDCQLSFRLRFGPMSLADYERMLPQGAAFERLKYWVLNYCGEHFFWDLQLVLRADEVPSTCLGRSTRLGWTSWLQTKPPAADVADLILNPPPDPTETVNS